MAGFRAGMQNAECHDGEHVLFVSEELANESTAKLEHEPHSYHDALKAMAAVLTDAGTMSTFSYPPFRCLVGRALPSGTS